MENNKEEKKKLLPSNKKSDYNYNQNIIELYIKECFFPRKQKND